MVLGWMHCRSGTSAPAHRTSEPNFNPLLVRLVLFVERVASSLSMSTLDLNADPQLARLRALVAARQKARWNEVPDRIHPTQSPSPRSRGGPMFQTIHLTASRGCQLLTRSSRWALGTYASAVRGRAWRTDQLAADKS